MSKKSQIQIDREYHKRCKEAEKRNDVPHYADRRTVGEKREDAYYDRRGKW